MLWDDRASPYLGRLADLDRPRADLLRDRAVSDGLKDALARHK